MPALTPSSIQYGSGICKVFNFTSASDGDTFVYDTGLTTARVAPPQAWWIENKSTADKITATYASGTFTFALSGGAGTPNFALFILKDPKIQL